MSLDSGGAIRATASFTTSDRPTTLGAGGGVLNVDGGESLGWAGVIGGTSLTKLGGGALVLSRTNTYSGGTSLFDGIVVVSSDANLGAASGGLTFDFGTLRTTSSFTTNRATSILDGGAFFDVDGGTTLTHGGVISSTPFGFLDKQGAGTLVLTGNNTHVSTVITDGTVRVGSNAALGAATGSVTLASGNGTLHATSSFNTTNRELVIDSAGGTVRVDGGAVLGWTGQLSGGGPLSVTGGGTLRLDANNSFSYAGDIGVAGATLQFANVNALPFAGSITLDSGQLRYTGATTQLLLSNSLSLAAGGGTIDVSNAAGSLNILSSISGAGGLTKVGAGTLRLSATNTYTGATTVDAGTLIVSGGQALANSSRTTINAPGALELLGNETVGSLAGNGSLLLTSGSLTTGGDGTSSAFSGVISGSGGVTKLGGGTMTLSGVNTYTGGTSIFDGAISIASDASLGAASGALNLDFGRLITTADITTGRTTSILDGGGFFETAAGTTLTHNGTIGSTAFGFLEKLGAGTMVLTGTNTHASTVVTEGVLQVSSNANLGAATANVTINGGTLRTATSFDTSARELVVNSGTLDIVGAGTTLGWTGQLSGAGTLTVTGGGTLRLDANNAFSFFGDLSILDSTLQIANVNALGTSGLLGLENATVRYTGAGSQNLTQPDVTIGGGGATFDVTSAGGSLNLATTLSGAGNIIKTGVGTLVLSGTNTRSGSTNIQQGTLSVQNGAALSDSTRVDVGAAGTFNLLGSETIGSLAGSGAVTLTGGTLTAGGDGTSTTFSGVISGPGGLTKLGAGTMTLSGANTYGGGTSIFDGAISVSSDANLGAASGALNLDFGRLITTASFTTNRATNIGDGGGFFETAAGATLTHGGVIGSTAFGFLEKQGAGTMVLTGANTHASTVITAGVLEVSSNANLGAATGNVNLNGGTLRTTASFDTTARELIVSGGSVDVVGAGNTLGWTGPLSGAGLLTKTGAGTLRLDGNSSGSFFGDFAMTGGALQFANVNALGTSGQVSIDAATLRYTGAGAQNLTQPDVVVGAGGAIFDVTSATGTLNLATTVSGTGVLDKIGAGTLQLSGANTRTGVTNIQQGTLSVLNGAALSDAHRVNVSAGATFGVLSSETIGSLSGAGSLNLAAGALTTGGDGTSTTFSGVISGAGGLVKTGAGVFTLTGTNTWLGGATVSGGTLQVSADANLGGAAGPLTLSGGGILETTASFTTARGTTLGAGGGVFDVNTGTTLTHNGVIGGAGGLTKADAGTLVLGGANTYAGGTIVNGGLVRISADANLGAAAGPLTLNGATLETTASLTTTRATTLGAAGGTFDVDAGTTLTHNGLIGGAGALTKTDTGVLALGGANTYAGGTIVNGGTVRVSADNNLGAAAGPLMLNGGVLESTASFTTTRGTALGAGGGTFNVNAGTTLTHNGAISGAGGLFKLDTGTLILGGVNSYAGGTFLNGGLTSVAADSALGAAGTALNFNGGGLETTASFTTARAAVLGAGNGRIDVNAGTTLTYAGVISGPGGLVKTDTGVLALNAVNTYAGGTTILDGLVRVSADNNLGAASGGLTLDGGGLETTASFTTARGTTLGAAGGTFNVDTGMTLTHTGVIAGAGGLTKTDLGTLVLTGANTYAGGTALNAGTVRVAADGNLGAASGLLTFNGGVLETTASFATARGTTLGGAGGAFDVDAGTTLTHNGVIGGAGSLTKTDTGTLVLTGTNTYAGGTSISGGVVRIGSNANLGAAAGPLNLQGGTLESTASLTTTRATTMAGTGGTFDVDAGTTLTHNGVIGGAGGLFKTDAGILLLGGVNTYTGGTTVNGGTLRVSADANLGGAAGTLTLNSGALQSTASFTTTRGTTLGAGGGTFDVDTGTTLTHNGVIGGAGGLIKTDAGVLVLGGTNTYAGGTIVNGGLVRAAADANLGAAAGGLTLNGGTLENTASFSTTRGTTLGASGGAFDVNAGTTLTHTGVIGGAGGLTKTDTGTLVLGGTNTYMGGTTVTGGILRVAADANLGAAAGLLTLSGATLNSTASFTTARGTTLGAGGGIFDAATGTTLTHNGVIGGVGSLTKVGAGTLTLGGANTYSGGTTVSADTLIGTTTSLQGNILNNAAVVFDQSISGVYAGVLSGTGTLTKTGSGTVRLDGVNTLSGATFVQAGSLIIQGSLANSTVNLSGGRLGGDGPIGGLIATGGVVAPGFSIGTLQVNGPVTLGAGSTYEVEADLTGASDRIVATGAATLQGGGVNLLLAPGQYAPGSQWLVLQAASVTGTFGAITDNANLGFLRPVALYTPTTASIQLQVDQPALIAAAQTSNQTQTATAAGQLPLNNAILGQLV